MAGKTCVPKQQMLLLFWKFEKDTDVATKKMVPKHVDNRTSNILGPLWSEIGYIFISISANSNLGS